MTDGKTRVMALIMRKKIIIRKYLGKSFEKSDYGY